MCKTAPPRVLRCRHRRRSSSPPVLRRRRKRHPCAPRAVPHARRTAGFCCSLVARRSPRSCPPVLAPQAAFNAEPRSLVTAPWPRPAILACPKESLPAPPMGRSSSHADVGSRCPCQIVVAPSAASPASPSSATVLWPTPTKSVTPRGASRAAPTRACCSAAAGGATPLTRPASMAGASLRAASSCASSAPLVARAAAQGRMLPMALRHAPTPNMRSPFQHRTPASTSSASANCSSVPSRSMMAPRSPR